MAQAITAESYAERRRAFFASMGEHSVAIFPAAATALRNGDAEYPYRQHSDFYYLSGYTESDALLVLTRAGEYCEFIVFNRDAGEKEALFCGPRLGQAGAIDVLKADKAYALDDEAALHALLRDKQQLYYTLGSFPDLDRRLGQWLSALRGRSRSGVDYPTCIIDSHALLSEQRLIKSEQEIAMMRHAAEVSAKAHIAVMRGARQAKTEAELEAEFLRACARQGLRQCAYSPIVAAGKNGCILHYVDNDAALSADELLLIDAGVEYQGYAADITRTFPLSGTFSEPQRALYEVVLAAQEAAIALIKPGVLWDEPQQLIINKLTQGLLDLGLLSGTLETCLADKAWRRFYGHGHGHWLGLDVHDVGAYKIDAAWRPLVPGMVLTVEPGLYIPPDCMDVDAQWRGLAVRIEDDVLVTATGCEVLSHGVPKKVAEIEAVMAQS